MFGVVSINTVSLLVSFCCILSTEGIACDNLTSRRCDTGEACYSLEQRCDGVAQCKDLSDEHNCTGPAQSSKANLAWLVTPVLFSLGVLYAVYKCFKDGICHMRRLHRHQRQRAENEAYVAVDDVQFYAMTPLSASQMAGRPAHVMFIHSCGPPSVGVRRPGGPGPVPPSYDEVMAASHAWQAPLSTVNEQDGELPPYSEVAPPGDGGDVFDEDDDDDDKMDDTCQLLEHHNLHESRHRHRSADTHRQQRHLGRRGSDVNRQRHRSEPSKTLH